MKRIDNDMRGNLIHLGCRIDTPPLIIASGHPEGHDQEEPFGYGTKRRTVHEVFPFLFAKKICKNAVILLKIISMLDLYQKFEK
jgi:hypothetical protein